MRGPTKRRELDPGTFVRFPTAIAFDRRVGITDARVLIYLDDKGQDAFPSAETIAQDLGMHERTARAAIDRMLDLGYLTKRERIVPGKGFKGFYYNLVYPRPGAGNPPGRSSDPGAGKSAGRQHPPGRGRQRRPGAGCSVDPGAGKPPDELDPLNDTHRTRGADADAPSGSGGGGRDDAPSDVADDHRGAAHARELAGGLAPAHDAGGERLEREARQDATSTREVPDQTGEDDLAIPAFLKRVKAEVKSEEAGHHAGRAPVARPMPGSDVKPDVEPSECGVQRAALERRDKAHEARQDRAFAPARADDGQPSKETPTMKDHDDDFGSMRPRQMLAWTADELQRLMPGRRWLELRQRVTHWHGKLVVLCDGDAAMAAGTLAGLVASPDLADLMFGVVLPETTARWSADARTDALINELTRAYPNGLREPVRGAVAVSAS